jgi:hypothetical protein
MLFKALWAFFLRFKKCSDIKNVHTMSENLYTQEWKFVFEWENTLNMITKYGFEDVILNFIYQGTS